MLDHRNVPRENGARDPRRLRGVFVALGGEDVASCMRRD